MPTGAHPTPLIQTVAAAAHACWCHALTADGWALAPVGASDPTARRHDGLRGYADLDLADRELIELAIGASDVPAMLAQLVDLPRGPARRLVLKELRVGLAVRLSDGVDISQPELAAEDVGGVANWARQPGSCFPRSIDVRWPSGLVTRHFPLDGDLARVEPGRA